MNSDALKKRVEEPWTIERLAKFIHLLLNREITLWGDAEPAVVRCVQEPCGRTCAKQKSQQRMQSDEQSNRLIENTVVLIRRIIRTIS